MKEKIFGFIHSLRGQLMLTHVIPVMVMIPLLLVALYYAMQTNKILLDMTKTIQEQANFITERAKNDPEIWTTQDTAENFIKEIRPNLKTGVVIFDSAWNILSFSGEYGVVGSESAPKVSFDLNADGLEPLLSISQYNPFRKSKDIVEMLIPVSDDSETVLGVIRLNFPTTYFENQLKRASGRMSLILAIGIILGCWLGLYLGNKIEKQITQTTYAIYDLSTGVSHDPLPETGTNELRHLSAAFNTLASKLDRSEQYRTKLTNHLTHELGRPLGALSSAADALQRGAWQDPELARELTIGMKNEIKRLENLVGDLALLRNESDPEARYVMEDTNLLQWLQSVYIYWAEFARSKNITLEDDFPNEMPHVMMDTFRFSQAIGNLISNAIKYTPAGGTVLLRACSDENEVCISVKDNGAGIPAEDLQHLFEPFFRGTAEKRFTQGMGLGLSIAHEVVQAHGGSITVESKEGEGSTFCICLPVKTDEKN